MMSILPSSHLPVYANENNLPKYSSFGSPITLYPIKVGSCDIAFKLDDKKTTAYHIRCNSCYKTDFFYTLHLTSNFDYPVLDIKSQNNQISLSNFAEKIPFTHFTDNSFNENLTGKLMTWSINKKNNNLLELTTTVLINDNYCSNIKNNSVIVAEYHTRISFWQFLKQKNLSQGKLQINPEFSYLSVTIAASIIALLEYNKRNLIWKCPI
ncbi:hypothetical protein HDU92_001935 [Lobulomyces angularis]|nr:hypothetical protein HDU92_001935 [Lobulomyces angularis]